MAHCQPVLLLIMFATLYRLEPGILPQKGLTPTLTKGLTPRFSQHIRCESNFINTQIKHFRNKLL